MAVTMNSVLFGEPVVGAMVPANFADYPERFSAFYRGHYRYVLGICQKYLWRREDAEDAAAEVFLKLQTLEAEEEPLTKPRSWLCKVTGRHCIDKLRKARVQSSRCAEDVECDDLPHSMDGSPLSRVLRREEQKRVREALRRLPREARILLVLHFYRQLTYVEIGAALGKQMPAVKTGVFRAKRLLREQLLNAA